MQAIVGADQAGRPQFRNQLLAGGFDIVEGPAAQSRDFRRLERGEIARGLGRAERLEHPVEQSGEPGVVERHVCHAGDPCQELPPLGQMREVPDEVAEPGHGAPRPHAVGAVATLAPARVVLGDPGHVRHGSKRKPGVTGRRHGRLAIEPFEQRLPLFAHLRGAGLRFAIARHLRGGERREIRRQLLGAELGQDMVEHGRHRRVVKLGRGRHETIVRPVFDPDRSEQAVGQDPDQIGAAFRHPHEGPDATLERRIDAGHAAAVGPMAWCADLGVGFGALGRGAVCLQQNGDCNRGYGRNPSERCPHASPIKAAELQW